MDNLLYWKDHNLKRSDIGKLASLELLEMKRPGKFPGLFSIKDVVLSHPRTVVNVNRSSGN